MHRVDRAADVAGRPGADDPDLAGGLVDLDLDHQALKLKTPICANGRPSATVRLGSKVFWSKTQLWVPISGPPAAQWARPEIVGEADRMLAARP